MEVIVDVMTFVTQSASGIVCLLSPEEPIGCRSSLKVRRGSRLDKNDPQPRKGSKTDFDLGS